MPAVIMSNDAPAFEGRVTGYVILCVIVSASAGLMFGYDIGISGGVTSMDDFLIKFFPSVYEKKKRALEDNYCKYDNQSLQLFTSSLYIAAMVASFAASWSCTKLGRKPTMQIASLFFVLGVILTAASVAVEMAIVGRILLGIGVGFGNQAAPLFLSELAPAHLRGALNICFQLCVTIGILIANMINYGTSKVHPHGWRISLGLGGIPAGILALGSLLICETPASLIERQKFEIGKRTLRKIRGIDNVEAEYESIVEASEAAKQVKAPYRELMKRPSRPPLVIAIMLQVFQQFSGINAIMFYAPVLFQTVGFGSDASLLSSLVTGLVNVFCTIIAVYAVDRVGRRILLLESVVHMCICLGLIGILLAKDLKSTNSLSKSEALFVLFLVCVYIVGFAWSWGPLGWLIPSETFPLKTRAAGYSFAVCTNMLFTFVIAQSFLSMLCHMKAGVFFFFCGWVFLSGLFAYFLIPETKNVPVDSIVERVWKQHWYWKRYVVDDYEDYVAATKSAEMVRPSVI